MQPFYFAKVPATTYAPGCIRHLTQYQFVREANRILLVTGARSFKKTNHYKRLIQQLQDTGSRLFETHVGKEPSPTFIDEQVTLHKKNNIELIIAIGGGSVLDAGKAISAMLTQDESVMAFLEGVGDGKIHNGHKIPFIAVPTTSGTGSEATKNAVLSEVGKTGFKKSIRHDSFVPDQVLLDPQLMVTCPPGVTAASGLDALTQLIGSYCSTQSSPITDALAISGIEYFSHSFIPVCNDEYDAIEKRGHIAYAAYLSGITLANAGLGIVHGFASSVGGYINIPHGVLCGTLLPEAVKLNVQLLEQQEDTFYLKKYAKVGAILTGCDEKDVKASCRNLVGILDQWINDLKIPRLGEFGIDEEDLDSIVGNTSYKYNPVPLNREQMKSILRARL